MAKPAWGGVGAWALDAERAEEEEERERAADPPAPAAATAAAAASFPSLREAAAAGGGKSKKKKGTTLSLSEFSTFGAGGAPGRRGAEPAKKLTTEEMMMLPTGPRERSADELDRTRLGGGFRSFGSGYGGSGDGGGRRGGFDDDGRRGPSSRVSDLDQPSRADEADNWSRDKKSFAPSPRDRYSSLGSGAGGGGGGTAGRADEIDNWSRDKKPLPSRYPSLGSGGGSFRDSPDPSDSDRWVRGGSGISAPPHNGERERPRLVLDPPKRDTAAAAAAAAATPPTEAARARPSPFGAARPREQVLADKGVDWRKMETEIEHKKTSRPTSSHSSRPNSAHSSRPGSPGSQVSAVGSEGAPRARPKVNPFGDAKPREVVLQEKGKDWRKIDLELEHRSIDRPETNEEKIMKEEISLMKADLKEIEVKINDGSDDVSTEDAKNLSEKIVQMEKELELLTIELDDKVRFGQRPGSGAGRITTLPPSGLSEEPQVAEAMDRPRSRGGVEPWAKPVEDKWGFQGNRERGSFGGSRSSDSRPVARQRW